MNEIDTSLEHLSLQLAMSSISCQNFSCSGSVVRLAMLILIATSRTPSCVARNTDPKAPCTQAGTSCHCMNEPYVTGNRADLQYLPDMKASVGKGWHRTQALPSMHCNRGGMSSGQCLAQVPQAAVWAPADFDGGGINLP